MWLHFAKIDASISLFYATQVKMLAAMEQCTEKLSPEDAKRNVHRGHLVLYAKDRALGSHGSLNATNFESLVFNEIDCEFFRSCVLRDPQKCFRVYCELTRRVDPIFPSLYRIPFTFKIERVGVLVSFLLQLLYFCSSFECDYPDCVKCIMTCDPQNWLRQCQWSEWLPESIFLLGHDEKFKM